MLNKQDYDLMLNDANDELFRP